MLITLGLAVLGASSCDKKYPEVHAREYHLCKILVEGDSVKNYFLRCIPYNSDDRREYELSIKSAYARGSMCMSAEHMGNVNKMIQETDALLEACLRDVKSLESEVQSLRF